VQQRRRGSILPHAPPSSSSHSETSRSRTRWRAGARRGFSRRAVPPGSSSQPMADGRFLLVPAVRERKREACLGRGTPPTRPLALRDPACRNLGPSANYPHPAPFLSREEVCSGWRALARPDNLIAADDRPGTGPDRRELVLRRRRDHIVARSSYRDRRASR
jgi:hypothetical protein